MASTTTPVNENNPRKRRRLNNNLATSDRMQVMVGIEKRKVEKLKEELSQTVTAKDAALKELGRIKSDTLSQLQSKNKEITKIQEKLQTIYRDNQQSKQTESTLLHKIEIFESQIQELQKENFQLRAKAHNKSKSEHSTTISNGHIATKIDPIEHIKLKKEIEIKQITINSQNEEIMRLEQQIEELHSHSSVNSDSLKKASKHIERLRKQIKNKTENQTNLAVSGMFLKNILLANSSHLSLHQIIRNGVHSGRI